MAAAAFSPALSQSADPIVDYWQCVQARAAHLEPSGETAEAIAVAATEFCAVKLGAVRATKLGAMDPALDEKTKAIGRDKAIKAVVEIRAARASR